MLKYIFILSLLIPFSSHAGKQHFVIPPRNPATPPAPGYTHQNPLITRYNTPPPGIDRPAGLADQSIDLNKYDPIMLHHNRCAPSDKSMQSLFEALAAISSSPTCGISKISLTQDGLNRDISATTKPAASGMFNPSNPACANLLFPADIVPIGFGTINIVGGSDQATAKIKWDGGGISETRTVDDWLWGTTDDPSTGFFSQLVAAGFCKIKSSPAATSNKSKTPVRN